MAESAISLVIDKLGLLLAQEVNLLKGVHKEVADIKDDLEDIRAFIKDADSKAKKEGISEGVRVWVKQAREVAYQIEDVIDKYMLHVAQHRDQHGFAGFLHKISSTVKKLQPQHEVASEIHDISKNVKKVKDRSERFQFISSGQGASSHNARSIMLHDPRLSSLSIEEAELVGFQSPRDELISLLVSGPSQRKVVSVVGLGGVGKTTITRKVYDNHKVKSYFECHTWITVSQSYDRKQLLMDMLQKFYEGSKKKLPENMVSMDHPSLIIELIKYLKAKHYLVVFDDVWETSFWGGVEHALVDNNNGSRILVTTRNKGVANFCMSSCLVHVYRMEPLLHQEAWELFCMKAFKIEFGGKCPKNLEELSHNIVRRCGGLPLVVVALGGLLATKEKTILELEKVLNSLASILIVDLHVEIVTKILSLSYDDLPYNLKSCFLYLGMFPEDFSIDCRSLIQLWVAERFVQEKQGMTLEDAADECLTELINRSLVQVDLVGLTGFPIRIRVHDMIREVILSKSEELNFCHVSSNHSTLDGIARYLSINIAGNDHLKTSTKSQIRSILLFNSTELQQPIIEAIFAECKLLTSLDFKKCQIDHIPKGLGKLLNLRYLNLQKTSVSKLPKSIGMLYNLEFLDLRYEVKELPVEINRFPKLRHLLGYKLKIHGSIGQLEFLQTLEGIEVDDGLIKELGMLKQLKHLGIDVLKGEDGRDLCMSLKEMTNLRSLNIGMDEIIEVTLILSDFGGH